MIQLSEEQQCILDTVKEGHNVMVDAVAGTGKTTLILSIAREMPDTKILQLTYNASLRKDVKETVEKNDIQNLTVHTYHSLAKRYYLSTGYTDTEIRRLLFKNMPLKEVSPKYDMIVLDECQDMTLLYFQLMVKFIKDIDCNIQLLILGDYMQGLYDFKGADIRFLTMADQVWEGLTNLTTQGFQKRTMKMSFRITNQMRNFVNDVMLGEERMNACRDGSVVTYVRNSRNNISRVVYGEITKLLENGVNPSEIFVLGGSVKGANSNIRRLENTLVEKDVPCHVPMLEGDKIDDRVIDGKVVFSTFHSVKGRQRKYVFVVGFDNAYFRFNARTLPRDICPNTLYVAATRATEGLYLLESNNYATDRPLEFLKKSHIDMKRCDYINFKGHHQTIFQDEEDMNINDNVVKKHRITPTELVKFISESVIETISPIIDRIFIKETDETITLEIPSVIETKKGYFEEVSDLNGIAIPCVYYDYLKEAFSETEEEFDNIPRGNVLFDVIDNAIDNMRMNDHIFLKEIVNSLPDKIETINDYLYVANVSVAVQETLYFKLKQIEPDEYNWLTDDMVMACKNRLREVIGPDCENTMPSVEDTIIHESSEEQHEKIDEYLRTIFDETQQFRFTGRVDLISETIAWELKCTSEITIEHLVQVIIYAWLWKMRHSYTEEYEEKVFKIFNIKTGEIFRLDATMEDLNTIVTTLLKGKFQEPVKKTDDEFIEDCQNCI
jgi:hypothetical protein